MFPASTIIFIKCRNRYHMKNNIRYKGNINITFVIIFLKSQKLPAMLLCLGEPPVRCFCCIFISFLIFMLMFFILFLMFYYHLSMFFILLLYLHLPLSSFCCCSFTFSFRRHPSPFRGLSPGFLHFIFYFQPSPLQIDSRHFHFRQFHLAASATALSEHFLPSSVFYFTLLPDILTCIYQGFPGSQQFFLEVCRASC